MPPGVNVFVSLVEGVMEIYFNAHTEQEAHKKAKSILARRKPFGPRCSKHRLAKVTRLGQAERNGRPVSYACTLKPAESFRIEALAAQGLDLSHLRNPRPADADETGRWIAELILKEVIRGEVVVGRASR
jgi:hypothetical protein